MCKSLNAGIFCSILILFSFFIGCKKNEDNAPPAPDLLPLTTMVMNFDDFPDANDYLVFANPDRFKNWGHADSMVNYWELLLHEEMVIPVTVYAEAFNRQASYNAENESWTWRYSVKVDIAGESIIFEAELTAAYENDKVLWEMYVSVENEYSDFLLFDGKSTKEQLGGEWTVYENPEYPDNLLLIGWIDLGDGQRGLSYKIAKDQSPDRLSYIQYGEVSGEFDRYYNIYTMRHDVISQIKWNNESKYGKVHDIWHFEDIDWHCWGPDQQDVDCR